MTETLGWGDVDVDEAPRRRRRLPAVLIWTVVAAVVAGIAVWPTARDTLVDRAANWLQRQWHIAGGFERSRSDIELAASQRLAAGDTSLWVALVQNLDQEEADKLTALAAAVGHHRLWASSVKTAGKAVRAALLAQAHDLRADIAVAPQLLPTSSFAESPYTSHTETLIQRAGDRVDAMVHARHLKQDTRSTPRLTAAATEVADLQRVTQAPVDLRLAVMHDSQLDVWDLSTGRVRRNVIDNLPVDSPNIFYGTGTTLLTQFGVNWGLLPPSGPRAIPLPAVSPTAFYQPDGDGGLWRSDEGRVRHYDATGHPTGPWYRYPLHLEEDPLGATRDAIISTVGAVNYNEPHPVLWFPRTGRIAPFDNPCPTVYEVGHRTIAYASCDASNVRVLDADSGRTKTLPLPRRLVLAGNDPVLSPDGSKLAVLAVRQGADIGEPSLYVFDVKTSAVTDVKTSAAPLTWSADSSVLVLNVNGDASAPTTENTPAGALPLAYWRPGMTQPAGIRLDLGSGSYTIAALP